MARLKQILAPANKAYYQEYWALRDVSFSVEPRQTVGIIGRNGAGKSTLLQLITGTVAPTTGTVRVRGRVSALLELGSGVNPEFTGRENIHILCTILGLSEEETTARVPEIIAFAELGEFLDQAVKTYSSGMYVRLAFATAIHVDADLIIIDEALAVGDFGFQFKCLNKITELVQAGATILLVTHDTALVQKYCDSVLYLRNGELVAQGEPQAVCEHYFADVMNIPQARSDARHPALSDRIEDPSWPDNVTRFEASVRGQRKGGRDNGEILLCLVNGTVWDVPPVRFGDSITIEVFFRITGKMLAPTIAFYVVDEAGQLIIGSNTTYESVMIAHAELGNIEGLRISFENRLGDGRFGVQVSLAEFQPGLLTSYEDHIPVVGRFSTFSPPDRTRWAKYTPRFHVEPI